MNTRSNSDDLDNRIPTRGDDILKKACSAEFGQKGCVEPTTDIKPTLKQGDVPASPQRPASRQPGSAALDEVVAVPDPEVSGASEDQEASFPEAACSPEFQQGCMDPLDA
jgi:hypothetical protein